MMATVHCPRCDFANPARLRFCGNCGHRIDERYPKVSPFVSLPSYHPSQHLTPEAFARFQEAVRQSCGHEHNVVVLVADLVGYTALSKKLDPEDLFSLINRYLAILIEVVYRHEGVIDRFTGDGIMALFGTPTPRASDPQRAMLAAIEMRGELERLSVEIRSEMEVDIQVRLGVHYGAIIYGRVGVNLDEETSVMDYTAIGDTVNLASRLEQAAGPNDTLVSQAVYRHTHDLIEYEAAGPLHFRDYGESVPAYRALGLRS